MRLNFREEYAVEKVWHICQVCEQLVLCDRMVIAEHLNQHEIGLEAYVAAYALQTAERNRVVNVKMDMTLVHLASPGGDDSVATAASFDGSHGGQDGSEEMDPTTPIAAMVKDESVQMVEEECQEILHETSVEVQPAVERDDRVNPVQNENVYQCLACEVRLSCWYTVKAHWKKEHAERVALTPMHRKLMLKEEHFHVCVICQKSVSAERHSVSNHLSKHKIFLADYERGQYESGRNKEPASNALVGHDPDEWVEDTPTAKHRRRSRRSRSPTPSGSGNKVATYINLAEKWVADGVATTSEVGNLCRYTCPECGKEMNHWKCLRKHVRDEHGEEWDIMDSDSTATTKMVHKCLECLAVMPCEVNCIYRHVSNHHGMSTAAYVEKHGLQLSQRLSSKSMSGMPYSTARPADEWPEDAEVTEDVNTPSTYVCSVCQATIHCRLALKKHLSQKHPEMAERDPDDMLVKLILHRCRQCHLLMRSELHVINVHVGRKHKMSMQEYAPERRNGRRCHGGRLPSTTGQPNVDEKTKICEELMDACTYMCPHCSELTSAWHDMTRHLSKNHAGLPLPSKEVALVEKFAYQCLLCDKKVLCEKYNVIYHLKRAHEVKGLGHFQSALQATPPSEDKEVYRKSLKEAIERFKQRTSDSVAQDVEETQEVRNLCRYKCCECHEEFAVWFNLREHLQHKHPKVIVPMTGRDSMTTKLVKHKCKLCSKLVRAEVADVNLHLRREHSIKPKTYRALDGQDVSEENPTPSDANRQKRRRPISTDYVADACTYACPVCKEGPSSWPVILAHLLREHPTLVSEEGEIRRLKSSSIVREVLHNCRICKESLPCNVEVSLFSFKKTSVYCDYLGY